MPISNAKTINASLVAPTVNRASQIALKHGKLPFQKMYKKLLGLKKILTVIPL
jgi:hypothetical protein